MMATLLKTVGISDSSRRLAQALAEIRDLDARRLELERELDSRIDLSFFDERLRIAGAQYEQSQSPEDLRALILEDLISQGARARTAVANAQRRYGVPGDKFRKEFPHWRETLLRACRLRLEIAQGEAERVLADERERLGDDFPEEELLHSPVVRRANSVVQNLELRLRQIESDLPEVCWTNNAPALRE